MKRPIGVVVSAVVLILGSLFQLLIALLTALGGVLLQKQIASGRLPSSPTAPPMQPWMPNLIFVGCAFFVALGVWGILTSIGLFRLRSWARYSVLVIGGGLAGLGLISCLMTLLMLAINLPVAAGVDPSQAHQVQAVSKVIFEGIAVFYAILCILGVSWLVYFNQENTRAVFSVKTEVVSASRRPILISVIAILNLVGAFSCLVIVFVPVPGAFLGWILHGWQKVALYLLMTGIEAAVGIGLWKLQEWGRQLNFGLLAFSLIQSIVYLLHPALMLRLSAEFNPAIVPSQLPERFLTTMNSASLSFTVLFVLAIGGAMVYYRTAFVAPTSKI